MRPRLKAAENRRVLPSKAGAGLSFNEAAA